MLDKHARKKLRDKIKKDGLVQPLIWNRRTGNLVGGHQRLSVIDDLEGSQDYSLTVAVVEVDDKTERELNVFLNNQSAMGAWDFDALGSMLKEGVDATELGFDLPELQTMFDDAGLASMFEKDTAADDVEKLKATKKRSKDLKTADAEHKARKELEDDSEFYLVVVFQSRTECDSFLAGAGLPADERYVDGRRMATQMGIELQKAPADPEPQTAVRA